MTEKEDEAYARGLRDAQIKELQKGQDEIRDEIKAARSYVWKIALGIIGTLTAQWAKLLGWFGGT